MRLRVLLTPILVFCLLVLGAVALNTARTNAQADECNERHLRNLGVAIVGCSEAPVCRGSGSMYGGSVELPGSIPKFWRDLIGAAAPTYPDVDPRLVAAVLYIENNSWPAPDKEWAVSSALARGPFQFLAQTWFGWDTGISTWGREFDETAYSAGGMGTDGDGDGKRDPLNPHDAVHAAFKHHRQSMGKPIAVQGYDPSASLESNVASVIFENDQSSNLLAYARAYNGGGNVKGAHTGERLSSYTNLDNDAYGRENKEYVLATFALLSTNFAQTYDYPSNQFSVTNGEEAGSGTTIGSSCGSGTGTISADGYAFPVSPQTRSGNGKVTAMSALPCGNANGCHHDGTGAFDMSKNPGGDNATGTPVYAISDGVIKSINNVYRKQQGCESIQLMSTKDNFWYSYLHIQGASVSEGQAVVAGQQIAVIGERRCTGNGSDPHLHIDRGCIQNGVPQRGGSPSCRDNGFIALINSLWETLPE